MFGPVFDISPEELFELFPEQMIPDIENISVTLKHDSLSICGNDTRWSLQSDIILVDGDGCMQFVFSEIQKIKIVHNKEETFVDAAQWINKKISGVTALRIIKRGEPWQFIFSGENRSTLTIYAQVNKIIWTPGAPDTPDAAEKR